MGIAVTPAILQTVVGLYAADVALDLYKRYKGLMNTNKQRAMQYAGEAFNADKTLKTNAQSMYDYMNRLPDYTPDMTVSERAKIAAFSAMRRSKESVVGRSSKGQLGSRCETARNIMLPIAAQSVSIQADARKYQFSLQEAYWQIKSRGIVGIASGGSYSGGVVSAFSSNANTLSRLANAYAGSFNGALATIGVGIGQLTNAATERKNENNFSVIQTEPPKPETIAPQTFESPGRITPA